MYYFLMLFFVCLGCNSNGFDSDPWAKEPDKTDSTDSTDKTDSTDSTDTAEEENRDLADEPTMIGGSYLTCSLLRSGEQPTPEGLSAIGCGLKTKDGQKYEIPPTIESRFVAFDSNKVPIDITSVVELPGSNPDWHWIITIPTNKVPRSSIQGTFRNEGSGDEAVLVAVITGSEGSCWAAVSAGIYGMGYPQQTFPDTILGNPAKHGENFDSTGGIFLGPSDQAYQAPIGPFNASCASQIGESDIEQAVCGDSIDSLAVAPGIHVEMSDGNGNILIQEDGPYMAIANDGGSNQTIVADFVRQRSSVMPEWMKTYLSANGFSIAERLMWETRSVKVTAIPGSGCE
jgi:hypothetical protein